MFEINKRFLQVVDYLNISAYKLSHELETSEAVLSNIKKGKNKPSIEIIEKILNKYKAINPAWLIIGEGEMLKSEETNYKDRIPESKPFIEKKHQDIFREKDEKILSLQNELIEIQRKLIECLENPQQPDKDVGQKRKVG